MRIFKTKEFARFASKNRISDGSMRNAVAEVESGLRRPNLASNLKKLRIARDGGGKSGGYRSIVVYKRGDRAIFVGGYAKRDRDDVKPNELRVFCNLASDMLALNSAELAKAIECGAITEI